MADDLMIEVTGASQSAENALTRVKRKLDELQASFEKAVPSVSKFAEQMNSISSGSKAVSSLKSFSDATLKSEEQVSKHNSRMALYNAQMEKAAAITAKAKAAQDNAAVAALKADSAFEKLANSAKKASQSESPLVLGTSEQTFTEPENTHADGWNEGFEKSRQEAEAFTARIRDKISSESATVTPNVDVSTANFRQLSEYIDSLRPAISSMSESAQAEFEAIAEKVTLLSQQIDNQRMLYHNLAEEAAKAAAAQGEGSTQYLQIEKRMLSTNSTIERLTDKENELKDQLYDTTIPAENLGDTLKDTGEKAESSAKKSKTAWQSFSQMMEKMLIRIAAFKLYSAVVQGFTTGLNDIVQYSDAANQSMSKLATSSLYFQNSVASAFMPVIESLAPYITDLINSVADVFNKIGMLNASLFGNADTVTVAKIAQVDYAASLNKTAKAAKEARESVMGFDEINALANPTSSSTSSISSPTPAQEFETVAIPQDIKDTADRIRALQPFFKGLGDVFNGFNDAIKNFTGTVLYKWLEDIGNWMEANPDTLYNLGKGLGYVAIGLIAFKSIKWLADVTGISKLVSWLLKLHSSTKDVTKAFNEKNRALTDQTADTAVETEAVKSLVPQMSTATEAAWVFAAALSAIAIPALNWGNLKFPTLTSATAPAIDLTAFETSKSEYLSSIATPIIMAATAPAIDLSQFEKSKAEYLAPIIAPIISIAIAPAIILSRFLATKYTYQSPISAPEIDAAVAPPIVLGDYLSSLDRTYLYTNIFTSAVSIAFSKMNTNVSHNMGKMSDVIPAVIGIGLSSAGIAIADFVNSASKAFADLGTNVSNNMVVAFQGAHDTILKSMRVTWDSYTTLMYALGKNVSSSWNAGDYATSVGFSLALVGLAIPAILVGAGALVGAANGALATGPSLLEVGEGTDNEAILPLNQSVFTSIAKGIRDNEGNSSSGDISRILERMDRLEESIRNMNFSLYTDDRKIAESANRGNKSIDRRYHSTALA